MLRTPTTRCYSTIAQALSMKPTGLAWKPTPHPTFKLVENAQSSPIVSIQLLPYTSVICQVDSLLAMSSDTQVGYATQGGVVSATFRKLYGGSWYYQQYSSTVPQSHHLIISPPKSSQCDHVTCLDLDGTSEYIVQRDALLAFGSRLNVSTLMKGLGLGQASGLWVYRLSGQGPVALMSRGHVIKVQLDSQEEYRVDASRLIAWDASMNPMTFKQVVSTKEASPSPSLRQRIQSLYTTVSQWNTQPTTPLVPFTDKLVSWSQKWMNRLVILVVSSMKSLQGRLLGKRELYTLKGPGSFYVATKAHSSLFNHLRN